MKRRWDFDDVFLGCLIGGFIVAAVLIAAYELF
jgi:hypothetical protein